MRNFVLIGAAGYVAPKHMKAIKDVGGNLLACTDPHDSVGILDSYFPNCQYFQEWERFDRYCNHNPIDYAVVCSPNYLHEAQVRWALKTGVDVICEKPLALYKRNLDKIADTSSKTGCNVNVILQLRLMQLFKDLKKSISSGHVVDINYITPRGNWYLFSWKGDDSKSGGLATNIGIHLFDIVLWLFGDCQDIKITAKKADKVSGTLYLEKATVTFNLSITGNKPVRTMTIDGKNIDFNTGFTELHTKSYEQILCGNGFGIQDAEPSIVLCEEIRKYELLGA